MESSAHLSDVMVVEGPLNSMSFDITVRNVITTIFVNLVGRVCIYCSLLQLIWAHPCSNRRSSSLHVQRNRQSRSSISCHRNKSHTMGGTRVSRIQLVSHCCYCLLLRIQLMFLEIV